MSFAAENLSPAERERIARECFTVKSTRGDELHGLCPFHKDKNPSFGYSIDKDAYNCFSCDAKGDLISLWAHHKGLHGKEVFKAFCEAFGIKNQDSRLRGNDNSSGSSTPAGKSPKAKIIPEAEWAELPLLSEVWRDRCREKFGWSNAVIDRFGLRVWTSPKDDKRIAIPIRDDKGKLRNIRKYLPGAAEYKVISWGKGYGSARLFPTPSEWEGSPIYLCEGEKDTLCALSQGLNAVTQTAGVKTWKESFSAEFEGLDVVVCYDADEPGQKYATKTAQSIAKVAKSVRIIRWPDYMGFNQNHGEDLTDFFVKHKNSLADFQDLLASAVTVEKPAAPEPEVNTKRFFGGVNGRRFMPALLAEAIMDDIEVVTDPVKGSMYRWSGKFWEDYELSYIRRKALIMLGQEASSSRAADAAGIVRDLSVLPHGRMMNDQENWVCLQNGMFNLDTRELSPFKKDFYANYSLGIDYDPQKTYTCPRWENFLFEVLNEDLETGIEIQKFFGYCLTRETRYEKALFLIGPGGDGKGTILNILQAMLGDENCSNISFGDLSKEFHRVRLMSKLLNVFTETTNEMFPSDMFKAIVSGDKIGASYKHVDTFDFKPFCKLAFSANQLPKVHDISEGFFRRIILVEFNNRYDESGKADLYLKEKLLEEMPGIFAWALQGLDFLRKEGFKRSKAQIKSMHGYRRSNNPVQCFVDDCIEPHPQMRPTKKAIYNAYKVYCNESGCRPLSREHFGRALFNLIPGLQTAREPRGKRETCYIGIQINTNDESHPRLSNPEPKDNKLPFEKNPS